MLPSCMKVKLSQVLSQQPLLASELETLAARRMQSQDWCHLLQMKSEKVV